MTLFLRSLLLSVLASLPIINAFAEIDPESNRTIRATTFNIRWFGLGGSLQGTPNDERRDSSIKDFLASHVMPTDVIAFQEIVDVRRLRALLPQGWTCVGYSHADRKHQHVELCTSPQYSFVKVAYDDNFSIESVTLNRPQSRPAVRADLVERTSGKKIVRFVAVHLKANPGESNTREAQAAKIAQDLAQANDDLPTVLLGDFNTYPASNSSSGPHDIARIENALARANFRNSIRHIPHTAAFTYRSRRHRSQFDHFYVTQDARVSRSPWVFSVCNSNKNNYADFNFYYDNVSDHCPTTISMELNN